MHPNMVSPKLIGQPEPNFKVISNCIDIINEIRKPQQVVIKAPGLKIDKIFATFKKDRDYFLEIEGQNRHVPVTFSSQFGISQNKHEIHFERLNISSRTLDSLQLNISSFYSLGYRKSSSYHYRLVIPISLRIDLEERIEYIQYSTKNTRSIECIRVNIQGASFDAYIHKEKRTQATFLVMESRSKFTYSEFDKHCYALIVSLGYVSGQLVGDEGYYFAYDDIDMKSPIHFHFSTLRSSIESQYYPIDIRASFFSITKEENKRIRKNLRVLSKAEFSTLCQWAYDSVDFSSILLLIIEASASSLLVMPSGLSVALEGLTDLIVKENEEKLAPIPDKTIAKQLKIDLLRVIDSNADKISVTGKKILKSRIDNINQLTNRSKLMAPFKLLKISLSSEDERAIEHRNDFLHGNTSLGLSNDIKTATGEVFYISLRLYTLLGLIILKRVGFDNYILNFPKIYEDFYKKKLDEESFRKL